MVPPALLAGQCGGDHGTGDRHQVAQLGVVTSLTQFSRSIGSTLGVAVFGSLLTNRFAPAMQTTLPPELKAALPADRLGQFQNPQALLNPQAAEQLRQQLLALGPQGAQLYDALLSAIKVALVSALHDVFLLGAALGVLGIVTVLFLKELPLRKSFGPPQAEGASETAAQVGHAAYPSLPQLKPEDHAAVRQPTPMPVGDAATQRRVRG